MDLSADISSSASTSWDI